MLATSALAFTRRAALVSALGWVVVPARGQSRAITVFAAASLKDALDKIIAERGRDTARVSYAASNTLALQIENGAPADVFISADVAWMDYLAGKGLLVDGTRLNLLGNRLALIAPKDSSASLEIRPGFALAAALGGGRLAIANVAAVPAGRYGRGALQSLGAWDDVKDKLAQAENVRAALLLVSRGEAPLGIVYTTDAAADPGIRIVGVFPESMHPRIVYPAASVKGANTAPAKAFLDDLRSPAASTIFERAGFAILPSGRGPA